MRALFATKTFLILFAINSASCTTYWPEGQPPDSGIYGRAYSLSDLSAERVVEIQSVDHGTTHRTVVHRDGYYRIDLFPGNYLIETGGTPRSIEIPPLQYLRIDLVFADDTR